MTKTLLTTMLIACGANGIFAATHIGKTDFSDLKSERIAVRTNVTRLPGERVLPNRFRAPEKETGNDLFPVKFNAPLKNYGRTIQKMDSVVRTSITGEPLSLQTFTYTSDGQYLRADNYILGNGKRTLYSYYNFEYDDFGRLTMRERINLSNPYEDVRFEYFYTDDSDLFSTLVTYSVDYATAELVPYQKVEYVYDESGNPVEQTFFYWNNTDSSWLLGGRETAGFDWLGRQTSYFKYIPNETGDELIGAKGETYIYVGDTLT